MKTIVTAAIASLITILPATAAPKAQPAPAPTATPAPEPTASLNLDRPATERRYCYDTEITGSRLTKRVCHTRADWKDLGVMVPEGL